MNSLQLHPWTEVFISKYIQVHQNILNTKNLLVQKDYISFICLSSVVCHIWIHEGKIKRHEGHVYAKRTVRASHCIPPKRVVNMQMRICVFPSPHASQRLCVHRLKPKNNLRGVWPFVTDVQDNSINTTTKDLALLHSLLLTNHFGHFRRHDSTKKEKGKDTILER